MSEKIKFEVNNDAPLFKDTLTVEESLFKALVEASFTDHSQDAVKWLRENVTSIEN
jgi:hypothetical protein